MKVSILLAAAVSIVMGLATLTSCGNYDDYNECHYAESRTVSDFDRVKISNAMTVNIVCAETQSVEIRADESLIDNVKTKVVDGELRVFLDGKHLVINKKRKIEVNITVPTLNSLEASGACAVDVDGFSNEDFSVNASGASDVDLYNLVAKGNIRLDVSGASNVKADGSADKVVIHASGASKVSAKYLITNIADVHASGASDVSIAVNDEIYAHSSGASDIDYYGRPAVVDVSESGAGDVTRH
ncbi:MAG: DUF2807 domain-containing protein [Bacteroidales bacterium]|nr:DUF2807 domain-containing protein [Bacteroidales bacterium]